MLPCLACRSNWCAHFLAATGQMFCRSCLDQSHFGSVNDIKRKQALLWVSARLICIIFANIKQNGFSSGKVFKGGGKTPSRYSKVWFEFSSDNLKRLACQSITTSITSDTLALITRRELCSLNKAKSKLYRSKVLGDICGYRYPLRIDFFSLKNQTETIVTTQLPITMMV